MSHESVAQLEQKLLETKKRMTATKRELDRVADEMSRLKKREHIAKLLKVGRIVEDAGILDTYNPNDLYLYLIMNRDLICHKRSLDNGLPQNFDFMSD